MKKTQEFADKIKADVSKIYDVNSIRFHFYEDGDLSIADGFWVYRSDFSNYDEEIINIVDRIKTHNNHNPIAIIDNTKLETKSLNSAIGFYNWMQDNYYQVGDGFVSDLNIDESKRVIITIEKAFGIYKEYQKGSSIFNK